MRHDLFISYSRKDQTWIEPIIQAFRSQGLSVWWDELVDEGRWGPAIESALNDAKRVVAFISRNVVAAERHFVEAEMLRAHSARKLIPIKIGEFTMPLHIEGIVIGEKMYFSPDFRHFVDSLGFRRICQVFGKGSNGPPVTTAQTGAEWLSSGPSLSEVAFATAIAVCESARIAVVTEFANDLERRLRMQLAPEDPAAAPRTMDDLFNSRSRQLEAVGALRYQETHGRYGFTYECVRFADAQRSTEFLMHVWDELDAIRSSVIDWLDHLTHTANADARQRIGLTIGALARTHFSSVYERLIGRWILDEHPATRDVADLALRVAVFDPTLKTAVERIVKDLSESRIVKELRAAVELACGYTGSQIEGLAIETLKRVGQSKHADFKVLAAMEDAINFMLRSAMEADDNSLLDLDKLIAELSKWVRSSKDGMHSRLPMYLFLYLMDRIPLAAPDTVDGLLSLRALTCLPDRKSDTAAVFDALLRDPGDNQNFSPRQGAQSILKKWQTDDARADLSDDDDPVLALGTAIYRICRSERDRNRLVFTLRRRYSKDQITGKEIVLIPDSSDEHQHGSRV